MTDMLCSMFSLQNKVLQALMLDCHEDQCEANVMTAINCDGSIIFVIIIDNTAVNLPVSVLSFWSGRDKCTTNIGRECGILWNFMYLAPIQITFSKVIIGV